jgi:hypothetical protein
VRLTKDTHSSDHRPVVLEMVELMVRRLEQSAARC